MYIDTINGSRSDLARRRTTLQRYVYYIFYNNITEQADDDDDNLNYSINNTSRKYENSLCNKACVGLHMNVFIFFSQYDLSRESRRNWFSESYIYIYIYKHDAVIMPSERSTLNSSILLQRFKNALHSDPEEEYPKELFRYIIVTRTREITIQ